MTPMPLTPKQKGWILLGALALAIVLLDQGTKMWAESDLKHRPGQNVTVIDGYLDLHYARNPGAAFSIFKDWSASSRGIFFVAVSLAAVGAMIVLYRQRSAPHASPSSSAISGCISGPLRQSAPAQLRLLISPSFSSYVCLSTAGASTSCRSPSTIRSS